MLDLWTFVLNNFYFTTMKFRYFFLFIVLFIKSANAQYALQDVFPNLPAFSSPTDAIIIPDGSNRILVLEQRGGLWIFDPQSATERRLFWDGKKVVSQNGCETGLLGCAFHPDFASNHYVFLSYTTGSNPQWSSHIVRYECSANKPDSIIPSSAVDILTIAQPTGLCNHKGGCLQFGPDGYLYASFGDGGSGGDPFKNGQSRSVLLGKILRLDVDHEANGNHYAIPASNPFASNTLGFKKEIYSYGMRNTWKFSFDKITGTLWAGDVGQDAYEEIDTIINGGNYGWNIMEGFHFYNGTASDTAGLKLPIWEYGHSNGNNAIMGGYVYRGSALPSLIGKYLYGDQGSGRVWALAVGNDPVKNQLIVDKQPSTISITSFMEDQNKEIYAVGYSGKIYKLISTASVNSTEILSNFSLRIERIFFDELHSQTGIHYSLPQPEHLVISIIDITGREIQRCVDTDKEEGHHLIQFDSRSLANGIYFIKLTAASGTLVQKISVMK